MSIAKTTGPVLLIAAAYASAETIESWYSEENNAPAGTIAATSDFHSPACNRGTRAIPSTSSASASAP